MEIKITHIDTACCLLEIDGFKILTDPTLDQAGKYYHHGWGTISKKTSTPQIDMQSLNDVDLVLLSHPQHGDNFDKKGKQFAKQVPLILSTKRIEKNYTNSHGMLPWEHQEFELKNGSKLKITATPCQHHPWWLPKFFSGEVIGFIIEHSQSDNAIYISGDTVFYRGIEEIARQFPNVSLALIHVGGVEFRYLTGLGKYTMNASGFIKTLKSIDPKIAIPIHNAGWTHFKENDEGIHREIKLHQTLQAEVQFLEMGRVTQINFF